MDEAKTQTIGKIAHSIAAAENKSNRFEEIKTSRRQETIEKLTSLLALSYDKATQAKQSKAQQKWITVSGYISQVLGRIVTDLEYERMRSDVEKLVEPVTKNVASKRPTVHRLETKSSEEDQRNH